MFKSLQRNFEVTFYNFLLILFSPLIWSGFNLIKPRRTKSNLNLKLFRLLWVITVFRLVACLLNMIFLKLRLLYQITYIYNSFIYISRGRNIKLNSFRSRLNPNVFQAPSSFLNSPFNEETVNMFCQSNNCVIIW